MMEAQKYKQIEAKMSGTSIEGKIVEVILALRSMKDDFEPAYYCGIELIVQKAMDQLTTHAGTYLHKDLEKNKIKNISKLIEAIPSCLGFRNSRGRLPIHTAAWNNRTRMLHVPALLAQEGIKHRIEFGSGPQNGIISRDNWRGGLLVKDPSAPDNMNTLQLMTRLGNSNDFEEGRHIIMDNLKDTKLMLKQDIQDYGLLYHACHPKSQQRFNTLLNWDPQGLKTHQYRGLSMIHAIIRYRKEIDNVLTFLKASIQRYPKEAGFLFLKDSHGKTACEQVFQKYGKNATFRMIGKCIPFDDPQIPILHHVIADAPQYLHEFSMRYPSAFHLRNVHGRSLNQHCLACGTKAYTTDAMFFLRMSDDEVGEIDPVTDLYPFLLAASEETSDLSAVYYLLRRDPSLVLGGNANVNVNVNVNTCADKRPTWKQGEDGHNTKFVSTSTSTFSRKQLVSSRKRKGGEQMHRRRSNSISWTCKVPRKLHPEFIAEEFLLEHNEV